MRICVCSKHLEYFQLIEWRRHKLLYTFKGEHTTIFTHNGQFTRLVNPVSTTWAGENICMSSMTLLLMESLRYKLDL